MRGALSAPALTKQDLYAQAVQSPRGDCAYLQRFYDLYVRDAAPPGELRPPARASLAELLLSVSG